MFDKTIFISVIIGLIAADAFVLGVKALSKLGKRKPKTKKA